ncbi:uncharacterized protein LOC117008009 [Catharus ustulatus]|uniref:uncharacterized protein LOC117008009 n=1 Tax=Catharus ustulatus TaxID=91951 RepID=UPI0014079D8C|nr:uncharacterized protein LOC117008009 [Catharus ustulatus]
MFSSGGASPSCLPCPKDFFSPRPGQNFCFPCGAGAVQPAEGQRTCECRGKGQIFQPRDALCTCPPGFRSSGRDGNSCVRRRYPVCRDAASRNQEGQCLGRRAWAHYCSHKVCAAPRDFQGYDKVLGLCICHPQSLEGTCNSQCRREQKTSLKLSCAGGKIQLFITHTNGSQTAVFLEGLRKVLPRPNFSLEDFCASGQQIHPAHVVEMSEKGFLGVYNPDPQLFHDLVVLNEAPALHKINSPSAATADHPDPEECKDPLSPPNSTSQPQFFGILNPISCGSGAVTLLFLISREHFPVYDVNNLYNTNADFDWGDFRILREELREIPRNSQEIFLFLFHFHTPGTYVLQLSSNRHKRMYVRVLPLGARCSEPAPFLPSSPRAALQLGIGPSRELLLSPERAGIAAGVCALLLLLLLFLWEKHSWERAHLEMSLLAQEMGAVCSFHQSAKELHGGDGGLQSTLASLLEQLSERHSQAGQALLQRHRDEIKRSNLSPELALPKQPQNFLAELPQELSFCQQRQPREVEPCPDSVTGMLQVAGMKVVKLEALGQRCLYRVLDLYSQLQVQALRDFHHSL